MNRREFLAAALIVPAAAAERSQSLSSEGWRLFEVTTHVHVQNASGATRAWLPTPLVGTSYQQTLGDTYQAEGGRVVMVESEELDLLYAEWPPGADPILTLTSRIAIRDYAADLTTPRVAPPPDLSGFARFLRPIKGLAIEEGAARGASTDLDRARTLFEAAAATGRTPGESIGTADPSLLFVAQVRAAGIPARPVYGLGLGSGDATRAQQSRAEVYLTGFGWVPIDLRQRTFGAWRGPWTAFNTAHDVALPKSPGAPLGAFMHPQAETANGRADSLSPETFRYEIAVRDVTRG